VTSVSYRLVTTTAAFSTKPTNAASAATTTATKYYSTISKHSATLSSTICKI